MERRWVCLATLGPIGTAALVYVVVVRGFVEADVDHELAWPLLGVLPMFVFGMWLLTVSATRTALFVALAATAMLVGSAYETVVQRNVELLAEPWFPLFNVIGLTADATATSTMLVVFATFPLGTVEHRWQRIGVASLWVPMLAGPLTLLTTPHVVMSPYIGISGDGIANPFAVPWLEWAAPLVQLLVVQAWPAVGVGLAVLGSRALFGAPEVRERTRVMAATVAFAMIGFALWTFLPGSGFAEFLVYASLIALPVAAIHGILRYGAFDIAPDERGLGVARSSNLLITVVYAIGVATPAILLGAQIEVVPAVLVTTILAVALLPVRAWLQRWIRRALFGDRERQLADANERLSAQLAAQLEELTASRARLIAAQDDERRRLERDLHDGIQQDVVAQIAALRLARNRLARGELTVDDLAELQDQARGTLTELRELARGIHPSVLSDNGLVAAVESGVARYPIPLEVIADSVVRRERYDDEVETTAYYVVREALANTAKHADASHARVGLARDDGRLRITIADDGRGLAVPAQAASATGGLANIRDRVAALGGTVQVSAGATAGTMVLVDLPAAVRDA